MKNCLSSIDAHCQNGVGSTPLFTLIIEAANISKKTITYQSQDFANDNTISECDNK